MIRILFALLFSLSLVACTEDTRPLDTGTAGDSATGDTATGDSSVMCIALGAECDGTVPCCAPNGCAGGFCGAPRDGGGDTATGDTSTGDAATCADFMESCATLPCCEPSAQCVSASMTCQPGKG